MSCHVLDGWQDGQKGLLGCRRNNPISQLFLWGWTSLLEKRFEEIKMEQVPSTFLKYTVRVGEPSLTRSSGGGELPVPEQRLSTCAVSVAEIGSLKMARQP